MSSELNFVQKRQRYIPIIACGLLTLVLSLFMLARFV